MAFDFDKFVAQAMQHKVPPLPEPEPKQPSAPPPSLPELTTTEAERIAAACPQSYVIVYASDMWDLRVGIEGTKELVDPADYELKFAARVYPSALSFTVWAPHEYE